jgi:hypothetical protein
MTHRGWWVNQSQGQQRTWSCDSISRPLWSVWSILSNQCCGMRIRITLMRNRILLFTMMRIRILSFTLMRIRILPGTFKFDADPDLDPTTHFPTDLDPPIPQNDPLRLPPLFTSMRIRILLFTLMRIRIQISSQCRSAQLP